MRGDDIRQFWRTGPPPALAADVVAFIGRRSIVPRSGFDVFPYAQPELLFHFADPFCIGPLGETASTPLPRAVLLGPRTARYRQCAGPRIHWFIIQLSPAGCRRLLGAPFGALLDRELPLGDLVGDDTADRLWDLLSAAADFASRVRIAASWIAAAAHASEPRGDADISRLAEIARPRPLLRVDHLAGRLDVTARRLHQRFSAELGIAPKYWLGLMRAHRYLQTLHPDTADLAFEYADESHAIREFKRYSGLTPGEYRAIKCRGDPLVNTGLSRVEE